MADVLNFFYPIAMQIQNVQFLKAVEILNAVNLVFAKHEDLNCAQWMLSGHNIGSQGFRDFRKQPPHTNTH